jgi:hypothetical protein
MKHRVSKLPRLRRRRNPLPSIPDPIPPESEDSDSFVNEFSIPPIVAAKIPRTPPQIRVAPHEPDKCAPERAPRFPSRRQAQEDAEANGETLTSEPEVNGEILPDNSDLQAVFDRVNAGLRRLLPRSAPAVGTKRNSAHQIVDYVSLLKESAELSEIEEQIEKLAKDSEPVDSRVVAHQLDEQLKMARKRIAALRGSGRKEVPIHVPEKAVALSREKESVAALQTEVEMLAAKVAACDKRIAIMTHRESAYGQIR